MSIYQNACGQNIEHKIHNDLQRKNAVDIVYTGLIRQKAGRAGSLVRLGTRRKYLGSQ